MMRVERDLCLIGIGYVRGSVIVWGGRFVHLRRGQLVHINHPGPAGFLFGESILVTKFPDVIKIDFKITGIIIIIFGEYFFCDRVPLTDGNTFCKAVRHQNRNAHVFFSRIPKHFQVNAGRDNIEVTVYVLGCIQQTNQILYLDTKFIGEAGQQSWEFSLCFNSWNRKNRRESILRQWFILCEGFQIKYFEYTNVTPKHEKDRWCEKRHANNSSMFFFLLDEGFFVFRLSVNPVVNILLLAKFLVRIVDPDIDGESAKCGQRRDTNASPFEYNHRCICSNAGRVANWQPLGEAKRCDGHHQGDQQTNDKNYYSDHLQTIDQSQVLAISLQGCCPQRSVVSGYGHDSSVPSWQSEACNAVRSNACYGAVS